MSGDRSDEPTVWAPFDADSAPPPPPPSLPSAAPVPPPYPQYVAPTQPQPQWGPPVEQPAFMQKPGAAEIKARNRRALLWALLALVVSIALMVVLFAFLFRNGATPEDFGGF